MKLTMYQVDAFTDKLFGGNPAGVVPLQEWLDDETMQKIALENNLSETAFFVKEENHYHIRWFTPTSEVPLCGHATLGSSFVIFNFIEKENQKLFFNSKSGELIVERKDDLLSLNFPAAKPEPVEMTDQFLNAFPFKPIEVLYAKDTYLFLFENEKQIREMKPDYNAIANINAHAVIVTAKGDEVDFVSRFFAPKIGINEDPVTGFAHTLLTPFWSEKLNKKEMSALQVSPRGGTLFVENMGERVKISGKGVLYLTGEINI